MMAACARLLNEDDVLERSAVQAAFDDNGNPVDEEREQYSRAVRDYMKENNLTQRLLGNMIGFSESTMSRWFKNEYEPRENVDNKVNELMTKDAKRKEIKSVSEIVYAETRISKTITQVLDYCVAQKSPGCIYGDPGVGKTYTTLEWAKGRNDTIILTMAPAIKSMKAVLKRIARALKVKSTGLLDDIYAELEDKLKVTDAIIIIDEAQHLSYSTVENIRILADTTQTAIVFIGNELVNSRIFGNSSAEFAQVFSRMYMKKHFQTKQFKVDDIEKVFGVLDAGASDLLLKVAQSRYGLRGAVILFTNARNNNDVTEKGLQAMAKATGIVC